MYHPLVTIIQELLKKHNAWFETFQHEEVRTSKEAASLRIGYSLEQGSKALLIQIRLAGGERKFIMCVLPGNKRVNAKKVRAMTDSKEIRFATEEEVFTLTDGVVPGGIPPFGNLFHLPVYVDKSLLQNEKIIFNAGDRKFSIAMRLEDYLTIAQPVVTDFTES